MKIDVLEYTKRASKIHAMHRQSIMEAMQRRDAFINEAARLAHAEWVDELERLSNEVVGQLAALEFEAFSNSAPA